MGNIVLLDELTINKIAAGEVIERPASVIKEMVENSIDAGAKNIIVEIKNGGISYIRVTDDGKGIAQDDLEIAFERHATSKIRSADDLNTVTSMGFRGEALASIAAIANVEMTSKTKEQDVGYRITVEAGNVLDKQEVGCQNGTSITVRNLFFNTPVRYKFLKKDYTESGYIEDVITRIALVHPELAIKLINTGKTVIQTNGNGDIKTVIYSIYGKDIANGVLPVNYKYEDIEVSGVIGKPEIARSNRSNQLFFVNKRYIKDKTLTAATEQAYKGLIPIGKFGFVVLNISMNPSKVDVNVHPAKLEVRFEEENKVFQAIYHAIKNTLLKSELVADPAKEREMKMQQAMNNRALTFDERLKNLKVNKKENVAQQSTGGLFGFRKQNEKQIEEYNDLESKIKTNAAEQNEKLKEETAEYKLEKPAQITAKETMPNSTQDSVKDAVPNSTQDSVKDAVPNSTQNSVKNAVPNSTQDSVKDAVPNSTDDDSKTDDFDTMYEKLFGRKPIEDETTEKQKNNTTEPKTEEELGTPVTIFSQEEQFKKPIYKFVGIVFKTYIILEMNDEMYILDQHAAHERIMYEKVKKNYYSEQNKDSQMLLLPDVITLTHKEMDIAKDNLDLFKKAGFTLEEFGDNTLKVTGVPTFCLDLDTKDLFLETLDEINTVARTAKQEKEEKFIATVACKAAVKANMALNELEVNSLMDQLLSLPNPFTCPHGRPTVIKITKYEIERKFARK